MSNLKQKKYCHGYSRTDGLEDWYYTGKDQNCQNRSNSNNNTDKFKDIEISEKEFYDEMFQIKNINYKTVSYNINDSEEDYYLFTNLIHKSIDELKDLYWKRWKVELHFKESKYNLSLNNINLKTENSLKQEIYIHNLLFILYYFFNIENNDYLLKTKYKINNKTGIKIFSENIIYLLIFNKLTKSCFEKIKKYFKLIIMNIVYIPDIKPCFERKRKRPYGKWYFSKK